MTRKPAPCLLLASSSPRRRALLRSMGLSFTVRVPGIEETPRPGEAPAAFAERAAREKAAAVAARLRRTRGAPRVVVGCDTIVVLDGHILGKPGTPESARRMLRALSGKTHRVVSGLCVLRETADGAWREASRAVTTEVVFRRLRRGEIDAYVASGGPMDKAGAYGIQEGAAHMVRALRGSYTNVVGLPLAEFSGEMLPRRSHAVSRGGSRAAARETR